MISTNEQLEILDLPPYVSCWSAASLPGFILSVFDRYQRNYADLPENFSLVVCPQAEINAIGGLPYRVRDLTDSRTRIQHLTGCNRLYLVLLLFGEDAAANREEIQHLLAWSEAYDVTLNENAAELRFISANEEIETIDYLTA